MVVCALHSKKPRDPDDQVKQQEVSYWITGYMFVASLHFMLDVVRECAGTSQIMPLVRSPQRYLCGEVHRGTGKS